MKRVALIDADSIAYAAACAVEEVFCWGDGQITVNSKGDMSDVRRHINEDMARLRKQCNGADMIVALSCPSAECWRLDVLPTYKANRNGLYRPAYLAEAKEYMERTWESFKRPRLEADDIVGILATHPTLVEGRKVIVSIDKDLRQVPGWLFNPQKDEKPRQISEEDADLWHLTLALAGDPVDGFDGCRLIGQGKATAFLADPYIAVPYEHVLLRGPRKGQIEVRWRKEPTEDRWLGIESLYEKSGLTAEDALIQARVARVLRANDYDMKRKEVKLWTPSVKASALALA